MFLYKKTPEILEGGPVRFRHYLGWAADIGRTFVELSNMSQTYARATMPPLPDTFRELGSRQILLPPFK